MFEEAFEDNLETEEKIEDVRLAKKEYEDGIYEDIKQEEEWYERHEKVAFRGSVSEVLIGDMEEGHLQLSITEMDEDGYLDVVADITAQPAVTQGVKRPERYCAYVEPRKEILSFIETYSLGTDTGKRLDKDKTSYPLYQFDAAKLKRLDPDGYSDYQAQVSQLEAKELQQQQKKEKQKKAKRGR